METNKAILLIKSYIRSYSLYDRLNYIGLNADNYYPDCIDVLKVFFDFDNESLDDFAEVFYLASEKLIDGHEFSRNHIPDEILTNTAIDIYSDWKALKQSIAKA